MRIAIFTDTFVPCVDGVVRTIMNRTEILGSRGHRFLIICPDYGTPEPRFEESISVVRVPSVPVPTYKDFRISWPAIRRVASVVREFRPDLLHMESYSVLGWVAVAVARLLDIPLVGTFHTIAAEFLQYLSPVRLLHLDRVAESVTRRTPILPTVRTPIKNAVWRYTALLYSHCDAVTAPSHSLVRELQKWRVPRVQYVTNGIDLASFPTSRTMNSPARKFIHVGRISFEKRVDVLLHAFRQAADVVPGLSLTVVGGGPALPAMTRLAHRLHITENVSFIGQQTFPQIVDRLLAADAFLTASPMESQGLVALEALAAGLPAVGVDRYGIPDLIQDGRNGLIARWPHVTNFARAIVFLARSENLDALSRESLAIARSHELRSSALAMENVYYSVAEPLGTG
jgi:1,2-diacylglycerol 3-alpha-glucosyltransferase